MQALIDTIESGWARKNDGARIRGDTDLITAVQNAIELLDSGTVRMAEKTDSGWQVKQWLKKAVLLSFHLNDSKVIAGSDSNFYDKVPLKFADFGKEEFDAAGRHDDGLADRSAVRWQRDPGATLRAARSGPARL